MTDDPYLAGHRPPQRQRRPGELLWTVRKDHVTWTGELRFHGESYGWEAQIFRETDLRIGRRFILREEAIGWAESERKDSRKATRARC
jgi:hypothetical protein